MLHTQPPTLLLAALAHHCQVALPVESASGMCFLELYVKSILALGVSFKLKLPSAAKCPTGCAAVLPQVGCIEHPGPGDE